MTAKETKTIKDVFMVYFCVLKKGIDDNAGEIFCYTVWENLATLASLMMSLDKKKFAAELCMFMDLKTNVKEKAKTAK